MSPARVAVVHEWIDAYAGSEQVFEAICQLYPGADLYALSQVPGVNLQLGGREITTTFLDRHLVRDKRALTLPLMPMAWRQLGRGRYDVVITSHHAFAHTNRLAMDGLHLCYVHTPARYIWSPGIDSRGESAALSVPRALLRRVDRRAAHRVTAYAANSSAVARRIEQFWGREAVVIPPPVRVDYFSGGDWQLGPTRDYLLGVGRWISYKNLDLVIQVGDYLGMPVKIAGSGPDRPRLEAAAERATVPVELVDSPADEDLRSLYRNAIALVFPTVEDFGMVPVEAQAAGTPVVAFRDGGAVDTVIDQVSGSLVESLTLDALAEGVLRSGQVASVDCRRSAGRFNEAEFRVRFSTWVSGQVQRVCQDWAL